MCGIAGFSEPGFDYTQSPSEWQPILARMNRVQKHRGPDDEGVYLQKGCGLSHVRLSILDLKNGHQPMLRRQGKDSCAIVFNGEIYNMQELKRQLELQGQIFQTTCDTEVILAGYMQEGVSFVKRLNGIFAFAIWDSRLQTLFLFRDRLGVKPLFYTIKGETLVFSSEIKGLFAYPNIRPVLDHDSLCEVFGLGPAKTYGKGVFRGVFEVLPGHYMTYAKEGLLDHVYWKLQSRPHEDSEKTTVEKTSFLLLDAIRKQMLSDIPICTFLSGGVYSSLLTAV